MASSMFIKDGESAINGSVGYFKGGAGDGTSIPFGLTYSWNGRLDLFAGLSLETYNGVSGTSVGAKSSPISLGAEYFILRETAQLPLSLSVMAGYSFGNLTGDIIDVYTNFGFTDVSLKVNSFKLGVAGYKNFALDKTSKVVAGAALVNTQSAFEFGYTLSSTATKTNTVENATSLVLGGTYVKELSKNWLATGGVSGSFSKFAPVWGLSASASYKF